MKRLNVDLAESGCIRSFTTHLITKCTRVKLNQLSVG